MAPLSIQVLSSTQVFPSTRPATPITTPLSILDAVVLNFAPSCAIWYYDAPLPTAQPSPLSPAHLIASLRQTLSAYPQWTGRLHFAAYTTKVGHCGDHNHRFHRLQTTCGTRSDPGVGLVIADCSQSLALIVPSAAERAGGDGVWDCSTLPTDQLFPSTEFSVSDEPDTASSPSMIVQLTTFSCGGMAIAVKLVHSLADAQALALFLHDWALTHRAMLNGISLPVLEPFFDPQMLDRAAAGDIDGVVPDAELVKKARGLPMERYDYWASANGAPDWALENVTVPSELSNSGVNVASVGTAIPWHEWDMAASDAHYVLHFSKEEVDGMWKEASLESPTPVSSRISRLDAALSFVWSLINRARGLKNDNCQVHMNISFGVRNRLSPPLPEKFVGSPLLNCDISTTGAEASMESITPMARRIRTTVARFNSGVLSAILHDMVHEISPQRIWQAFLGRRHVIATSWVHQHVYEVDFGTGLSPRYVGMVIPSSDGVLQVTEAAPKHEKASGVRHWVEDGVDISLYLEKKAMERLVKDQMLRKYRT